jgi:CRISPR-associated protein Cas1
MVAMANLYITEQNSILRKTGDRLLVKKEDQVLLDVQCHKLGAVLIFGNVQFTTQAVHELMEHGIELAILTRTGKLVGQLTSPATKNIELRLRQFRRYDDPEFRLEYSKSLVAAKIANSLSLLKSYARNHPEAAPTEAMDELNRLQTAPKSAATLESLRGIEGTAARVYFRGLSETIRTDLPFDGRHKRPPTDPVNALLSLGYVMLFNEISSLLDGLGFDPYLGYFHAVDYGRASLAADLMEPFRAPVVDHFTLNLLNLGMFKIDDFKENPHGEAVYLKRESLQRYFVEYEKFLGCEFVHAGSGRSTTYRACFRQQAENLAATLSEGIPFQPFLMAV